MADAFLGTEDHDLSRLIDGLSRTTEGLGRNEVQLKDLVTNFNTTVAATASQATNLRASIRLLGPTLQNADQRAGLAERLVPQHARLRARDPARRQRDGRHHRRRLPVDRPGARAARARPSCRASRRELSPATRDLAKVIDATPGAAAAGRPGGQVRDARRAADRRREDRRRRRSRPAPRTTRSSGTRWSASPARARTSTATACTCASSPAAATRPSRWAASGGLADKLFANAILKPLGTRPAFPGKRPPYKPDVPCYKNPLPEPQTAPRRRGAARRAAARRARASHRSQGGSAGDEDRDPQARARLRLRPGPGRWWRALVGGYILSNQRFYLPHWVPVARLGLRRLQGPVLHRAVGDAGPGPDRPDRRRRRGRHHQGRPRRRARRGDDEDPAQVHADLQERHRAAAPQDRPQRHGHRAGPRLADGGHGARRAGPSRSTRRCPTSTSTRSSPRWTPTRAATCSCSSAPRARGSTARARPCRPTSSASSRPAATWPSSTARWPCASATSAARSTTSACSRRRWATRTTTWRRWSTPPTGCSRRSPTRTPTCARRCRSCPAPWTRRTPRWPRSTSWARCSGRPSAPCDPAPAPSGRRWSRRARSSTQTTPIIQNQLRPFARAALPVVKVLRPAASDLARGHARS